jgi:hypothetical protein
MITHIRGTDVESTLHAAAEPTFVPGASSRPTSTAVACPALWRRPG